MKFEIDALPYQFKDLEPHISARTVEIHYEKHHKGYMKKLRDAIEGKPEADMEIEQLIFSAQGDLFNNASQVWNHSFYWKSMSPDGGGEPTGAVLEALNDAFGSVAKFKAEFAEAANGEFGSGWAWLVADHKRRLHVISSSDAESPLQRALTPLLTLDVWEHAYYLDHQNQRDRYVAGFLDHLIDWDFAETNLAQNV